MPKVSTGAKETEVPASERILLRPDSAAEMLSINPQSLEKLPIRRIRLKELRGVFYKRVDLEEWAKNL
jgi:hypothetical protein